MSSAIRIEISDAPAADVVHRFRSFGEDVFRELQEVCEVRLEEIDRATTSFVLRGIVRRDLGRVTEALRRQLRRHGFERTATLCRL